MAYKAPSTRKGDYSSNIYRLLSDRYFYSNAQRHRFTWRAMNQGYYTSENRELLEEVTSTGVNLLPYLMKTLVDLRGRYLHKDLPKTIRLGFRSGDWDLCKLIYTVNYFAPLLQKEYWESLVQQLSQAIQEQRGRETITDLLSRIDYYIFMTGVEDPLYQLSRMDLNLLPWILEDLLHQERGLYTAFSSFMKNSPQWFTEECRSTLHELGRKGYATLARNLYKEVTRYAPQQIREEDHEFFHDVLTEYDTLHSLNERGKHHLEEKQIGPAIECFQKVMEVDPYFFRAVFNLGLSLKLSGNNYGAFIYFKMALSLLPEDLKRQVQSASELIYTAGTLYDEKIPPNFTMDDLPI